MIARVQQCLVLSVVACAAAWLAIFWSRSAPVALAGCLGILFCYSGMLAVQFLMLARISRRDSTPPASTLQLLLAWLVETVVAARVFFWWQPFRSNAIADQPPPAPPASSPRGIVLLHGFVCNRGLWTVWMGALRRRGIPFAAVNLEPVFGGIDGYAAIVDRAVREMLRTTGRPPMLVCHSMGGLVARAWLRACAADVMVHHVVTIGSPHHGTVIGKLGAGAPGVVNGNQVAFHGPWLAALERDEPPRRIRRFTCFYSNCDNIVMPTSTATLAGADNRLVAGVPHLALALDQRIIEHCLRLL